MNGILQGGYRSDCGVRKKRERERKKYANDDKFRSLFLGQRAGYFFLSLFSFRSIVNFLQCVKGCY